MKWDRLLGLSLAGEYPLEEILGESESGAWFQTFSEARNQRAVLEVISEENSAGEQQLACWRRVRLLSHPHLQLLFDCGRAAHHGETLLYAVFENPDDNLDAALSNGGLSDAETQEVMEAARGALEYLHAQGLAHGAVDARHIIAVGDRVKLTSDSVHAAAPGALEEDLRALDEALGLNKVKEAPPPVEVAPVMEAIETEPVAAREPVAVAEPAAVAEPVSVVKPPALREPVKAAPALPPPTVHPMRDREKEPGPAPPLQNVKRIWAYSAAAAALVALLIAMARQPGSVPDAPTAAAGPVVATPKPAPPVVQQAPPQPTVAARKLVPQQEVAVAHRSAEPRPRTEWRVIAYTYSHLKDAENKARSINQQVPGLKAEVYTPKGRNQPPYLVALGGRMTRTDAAGLQRKALSRGLPKDTFIRNYVD